MRHCAPTWPRGCPAAEAAARSGYTPASLLSAVRDFRAGARGLLRHRKARPEDRPGQNAARPRIIELRAAGHSIDEIAWALAAEGTPLNRTGIAEQGLPRMWRRPEADRGGPAREIQVRAEAADFAALRGMAETRLAGLFLAIPDLIALGIPDLVAAAGYPCTSKIPALSYILSLLAPKLTSTRRARSCLPPAQYPLTLSMSRTRPAGQPAGRHRGAAATPVCHFSSHAPTDDSRQLPVGDHIPLDGVSLRVNAGGDSVLWHLTTI